MELYKESRIIGAFKGWNQDQVFELVNGSLWLQVKYKYKYRYKYRPQVKIFRDGSRYFLSVDGMDEMIEVRKITRDRAVEIKKSKEEDSQD